MTKIDELKHIVSKHTHNFTKVHGQFAVNNGDQDGVKQLMAQHYMLEITPAKQKSWNIKFWRY